MLYGNLDFQLLLENWKMWWLCVHVPTQEASAGALPFAPLFTPPYCLPHSAFSHLCYLPGPVGTEVCSPFFQNLLPLQMSVLL